MIEHRIATRNRTLLPAQIEIYDSGVRLECVIKDLSETGARVALSGAVAVPRSFRMHIPKLNRSLMATIQWRRGELIGIAFEPEDESAHAADAPEDRIRIQKLEAEIGRLRRTLAAIRADPSQARLILDQAD